MKTSLLLTTALLTILGALGTSSIQAGALAHERLKIHNDFKRPEEVVSYYCARDASGFVWTGLLDAERTAFTFWQESPQQDTFYLAKDYIVNPGQIDGSAQDHATVSVAYDVTAIGDGHGTRVPVKEPKRTVQFDLKKVGGVWKIARPLPGDIAPVVLESKFPYSVAQN